jgi:hypothetical protein
VAAFAAIAGVAAVAEIAGAAAVASNYSKQSLLLQLPPLLAGGRILEMGFGGFALV